MTCYVDGDILMSEFGAKLKQARERRGISQRQIAAATKISVVALEALERNDFSRLPGGIFSRAFVRAYALEVGLDPDQTVQEFLVAYEENHHRAAERAAPEVTADDRLFLERQRRAARWLRLISLGLAVVLAVALISWRISSGGPAAPAEAVIESEPTVLVPPPPPDPVVPEPAGSPAVPPVVGENQVGLRLRTSGDCWVRATVDGTVVFEQIMTAGEVQDIRPGQEIHLQVGNAGALEWWINGQPAAPLGEPGATATARISPATLDRYLPQ